MACFYFWMDGLRTPSTAKLTKDDYNFHVLNVIRYLFRFMNMESWHDVPHCTYILQTTITSIIVYHSSKSIKGYQNLLHYIHYWDMISLIIPTLCSQANLWCPITNLCRWMTCCSTMCHPLSYCWISMWISSP